MGFFSKFKEKLGKRVDEISKNVDSIVEKTGEALKFEKIRGGLDKTRKSFVERLASVLGTGRKIDDKLLEEIEEILITSDMGVQTTEDIIENLKIRVRKDKIEDSAEVFRILKEEIHALLIKSPAPTNDKNYEINESDKPLVIMVIGVNGVGKTTTIGKLAYNYKNAGKEVVIGAADTFRAAANEQLEIWS